MNFNIFLNFILVASFPLEPALHRGTRDLVSWNKLHNISNRLRLKHVGEKIREEMDKKEPKKTYLEQIKEFLKSREVVIPEVRST